MADETSNSDNPAANAGDDIPEVEAEIVVEGEAPAQEGAFTNRKADANAADADTDTKPAPKRMPFTPGVILFFGFAGLALTVFVLWRLQGPGAPPVAATPPAQEEVAPTDVKEGDNAEALVEDSKKEASTAPDLTAPSAENTTKAGVDQRVEAVAEADPGKIENSAPEEIKSAANDFRSITGTTTGGDVYLPSLDADKAASGGNQALQQAAKDAYRSIQSEAEPNLAANDNQPATPQPDDALAFDVETGDAATAAPSQPDIDQSIVSTGGGAQSGADAEQRAARADQTPPAFGASDETSKVLNQMAALKENFETEKAQLTQALSDERKRNQDQRAEIEALRRDFQIALDARGEQANAEIEQLRQRIDKIRNDEITPVARRVIGAVALRALESAFDQGAPFEIELQQLVQAAPDAPAVMVLRKYAQAGVAPLTTLKERFGSAARDALAAAGKENAKGFWGSLKAQAQSIISVRPAVPQPGNSVGAIVSRAENAVENNDLSGAIAELNMLSPAARLVMAPWIEDAEARIDVATAIQDLNNSILGAL